MGRGEDSAQRVVPGSVKPRRHLLSMRGASRSPRRLCRFDSCSCDLRPSGQRRDEASEDVERTLLFHLDSFHEGFMRLPRPKQCIGLLRRGQIRYASVIRNSAEIHLCLPPPEFRCSWLTRHRSGVDSSLARGKGAARLAADRPLALRHPAPRGRGHVPRTPCRRGPRGGFYACACSACSYSALLWSTPDRARPTYPARACHALRRSPRIDPAVEELADAA
jgi:hypothetical protein